jgi:hypothetical protein
MASVTCMHLRFDNVESDPFTRGNEARVAFLQIGRKTPRKWRIS